MGFLWGANSQGGAVKMSSAFGKKTLLAEACLRTGFEGVEPWKTLQGMKDAIDMKLESSQGYEKSSPGEFYFSFCCLFVHPIPGYLGAFELFCQSILPKKKISASLIMTLSLLTEGPIKALKDLQELIEECKPQEDSLLFFGDFHEKCKTRSNPSLLHMKYMNARDEEPGDEQEQLMISYLKTLAQLTQRKPISPNNT
jgi:hypothetical protein